MTTFEAIHIKVGDLVKETHSLGHDKGTVLEVDTHAVHISWELRSSTWIRFVEFEDIEERIRG